ncbi:MAG: nucleotidyltransferase family protein [Candidatus Faecousia sp.]|nr:nucleotidyltransferase family protein [Clostridiales bacterium]MCI6937707.1 nucleotidyltransferase family protein [Clostridiales bacterium]MDD5883124.1 nucleotidyltransferase family protein [Bacillota bacterium]MDY4598300.1 nucleotidyltransferase family protein [Candidatus Faecousia sp.]
MNVGIVCEYNPFHLGHQKQIDSIREKFGANTGIICAMSGNYVQRGHPSVFDKTIRAEAAIRCGADLVVELPVTTSLSSAEGFAASGVAVLSRLCDGLCFGAETADLQQLLGTAEALLSEDFPKLLRRELERGCSFPAARQAALEKMGLPGAILESPNNILAVEYCKAILRQSSPMRPLPISREGSYHAKEADFENPSATSLRIRLQNGLDISGYLPEAAGQVFAGAPIHTLEAGQRAVLSRLRTMEDAEFEALPFGSEGLWRKLMRESRKQATLEDIAAAVKSKRYTRSRIDRMILCAFLGITVQTMEAEIPYVRVLAFNDRGREILSGAKKDGFFLNAGQPTPHPLWEMEQRWEDLYSLFQAGVPGQPGAAKNRRVIYLR